MSNSTLSAKRETLVLLEHGEGKSCIMITHRIGLKTETCRIPLVLSRKDPFDVEHKNPDNF